MNVTVQSHTACNVHHGALTPKHSRCNIDVDGKTATLGSANRLENPLPRFNTALHWDFPSRLEEGTLNCNKVLAGGLPHEMVKKINADKNIIVHAIVSLNEGLNDLKWDPARLLNNNTMFVIPTGSAALPRFTTITWKNNG